MTLTKISRLRIFLLVAFAAGAWTPGCSTHTGNPENVTEGTKKVSIQFTTASTAGLDEFLLCPAKVQFYASADDKASEAFESLILHPAPFISISPQGITVYGTFEYELPDNQPIERLDLTMSDRCQQGYSAQATNASGTFTTAQTFKLKFYGGYVTSSKSTTFTFDVSNFMHAASKLTDPQAESLKTALTATTGYFSAE